MMISKQNTGLAALAAAALLSMMTPAQAGLIGDSFTVSAYSPNLSTPLGSSTTATATGLNNPIALLDSGNIAVNITDAQIIISWAPSTSNRNYPATPFTGGVLVNNTEDFPLLALDAATNLSGFDSSRFWVVDNTLYVNIEGLSSTPLSQIVLDVPEPLSLAVFATGLAGLALHRRRRANAVPSLQQPA